MSSPSLKIDHPSVNITFGKPSAKATWSYGGSTPAYSYGGNTYNASGYLANPSRSAQIQARDAGALTNYEASRMGLSNRR
jgi:hypothetical protein